MMKASSRASVGAGTKSAEARSINEFQLKAPPPTVRIRCFNDVRERTASIGPASSGVETAAMASLLRKIFSTSCSRNRKLDGITTAPSFSAPRIATIAWRFVPSRSITRSPRCTPSPRRTLAKRFDNSRNPAYVYGESSNHAATFEPRPASTCLSIIARAMLNSAGMERYGREASSSDFITSLPMPVPRVALLTEPSV